MKYNELKQLLVEAANPTKANLNFNDVQSAAVNALKEYLGVGSASIREILRNQDIMFDIINEVVDEVLPIKLQERTREFAEVMQIERDQKAVFNIRTTNASRQRVARGIQKGARGGIYKARRLDGTTFEVATMVETVGYMITLEEILTGTRTINELVEVLADAWEEKIYIEVFGALSAAAAAAPAVNKVIGTTTIAEEHLDPLIGIVRGYGVPTILAFPQHAAKIPLNKSAEVDKVDVRERGYVGTYKGTNVVILPNYIVNHGDSAITWVFDENKVFILPANEKPVKVVLQGESYTSEVNQAHGGKEFHQHRLMGIAVLFNKNIASYQLTDIWSSWQGQP